jgi:hypothetical protein
MARVASKYCSTTRNSKLTNNIGEGRDKEGREQGMKILIIVLVIMVVLFVVLMVWGYKNNKSQTDAKDFEPTSVLTGFNTILAPFAPKLDPKQLQPPLASCDLRSKPSCAITVSPDASHKSRQAKFKIQPANTPPCASVVYKFSGCEMSPDSDNPCQVSDKSKNPNEFTFAILTGGGSLTISRNAPSNNGSCKVSLE